MGIDIEALKEEVFPRVVTIGGVEILDTLLMTWLLMALLGLGCWLATRRLQILPSRSQSVLELIVEWIMKQISDVTGASPKGFLTLVGSLVIFIAASMLLPLIPKTKAPTGDFNTTAALATVVFFSVPYYGIRQNGFKGYFKQYLKPVPFLLPLNVLGELSRTLSLAIRLFANCISGGFLAGVAFFLMGAGIGAFTKAPVQIFGAFTGLIQAYVFMLLALVYIGSAVRPGGDEEKT